MDIEPNDLSSAIRTLYPGHKAELVSLLPEAEVVEVRDGSGQLAYSRVGDFTIRILLRMTERHE